jgi:hypothetical protein
MRWPSALNFIIACQSWVYNFCNTASAQCTHFTKSPMQPIIIVLLHFTILFFQAYILPLFINILIQLHILTIASCSGIFSRINLIGCILPSCMLFIFLHIMHASSIFLHLFYLLVSSTCQVVQNLCVPLSMHLTKLLEEDYNHPYCKLVPSCLHAIYMPRN